MGSTLFVLLMVAFGAMVIRGLIQLIIGIQIILEDGQSVIAWLPFWFIDMLTFGFIAGRKA